MVLQKWSYIGKWLVPHKGAKELFGVGCGLIHSVLETPKAPTHPHPFQVGVSGISTAKNQNAQTSPLICKGDIVERDEEAMQAHQKALRKHTA